MNDSPVAIIGMSIALPGAGTDPRRYVADLRAGADRVGQVPPERKADSGLRPDDALPELALLDRIDAFDFAFFRISPREAERMDPQHRLALELACAAIWDAGYSLSSLGGTRTAVLLAGSKETYSTLCDPSDGLAITGALASGLAGRVAYALDLNGPAIAVDTACSSSLVALHEASWKVRSGEADLALAGGVRLISTLARERPALGILSPDGRSRPFDAAANGTGVGEGGAVFLLKSLPRALADGDPIRAVLRGGAVNHDGARSNGFAAPSPAAQTEVLLRAWDRAGVAAEEIGYVEAHGTGTRLGDPIEAKALDDAFRSRTRRVGFCTLGAVKSNIGHLDAAAGAAGVAKVVLSLQERTLFPTAHFSALNPLISFEGSALAVSRECRPWESDRPRLAGVSSFGIIGTNAHLVLEEAPRPPPRPEPSGPWLFPLSGKTEGAARRSAAALAAELAAAPHRLDDVALTLSVGRDHFVHRAACVAAAPAELSRALEAIGRGEGEVRPAPQGLRHALVLSGDAVSGSPPRQGMERLLTMVGTWIDAGLRPDAWIASGLANAAVDVLRDGLDRERALAELPAAAALDLDRLHEAMASLASEGPVIFLLPWGGALADAVREIASGLPGAEARALPGAGGRGAVLAELAELYRAGVDPDWRRLHAGTTGRRVALPPYPFERTRCWVEVRPSQPEANVAPAPAGEPSDAPVSAPEVAGRASTLEVLQEIWREVLGVQAVAPEDDFFDLGGDSLMQTQLTNAIQRRLGITISFDVVFDHPVLQDFAVQLEKARSFEAQAFAPPRPGLVARHRSVAPLSHSQLRMWFLQQMDAESHAYHVGLRFRVGGPLDAGILQRALDAVAARHAILRTTYGVEGDGPVQRIGPPAPFTLQVVDASGHEAARARQVLAKDMAAPFDLERGPVARAVLVRVAPDEHLVQLTAHHIASDNWSMGLWCSELAESYAALAAGRAPALPPLEAQYADWAAWEREVLAGPRRAKLEELWRERLSGAPRELSLPTDRPRPARRTGQGAWVRLQVPVDLAERVRVLGRLEQASLFNVLLAGFSALLVRFAGQEDLVVGTPVANRLHPAAEPLIGCFINTLPLRVRAGGAPSFRELLGRLRTECAGAFAHQELPFDRIVELAGASRRSDRSPLVQTAFALQNTPVSRAPWPEALSVEQLPLDGDVSWFDLSAALWEEPGGSLEGLLAYDTASFDLATMEIFARQYQTLLASAVEDPGASIHALSLGGEEPLPATGTTG